MLEMPDGDELYDRGYIMDVVEYLKKHGVKFELTEHHSAYTAQELAGYEHVLEIEVVKPVIVKADGIFYMCVLPACFKVDLEILKYDLDANFVELATEEEMLELFRDCPPGAECPIGSLYGLPTLMDATLENDRYIVFQAGCYDKAVRMHMSDYKDLTSPYVMDFSYQQDWSEADTMLNDPFYYDRFVYSLLYPL